VEPNGNDDGAKQGDRSSIARYGHSRTAPSEHLRSFDAIESFNVRLRNTGFADRSIRCLCRDLPPMVGYAATACLRTDEPPIAGRTYHDRADWWNSILQVPAPRIPVLEDMDKPPGVGASWVKCMPQFSWQLVVSVT
jgi:hypothetical protein